MATDVHSVEHRYLLTSSHANNNNNTHNSILCIYDLSSRKSIPTISPVLQVNAQSILSALQWYPVDTGMFFTVSTAAIVAVWDTNQLQVVQTFQPFQYEDSLVAGGYSSSMEWSPHQAHLGAVGTKGVEPIRLIDLRAGHAAQSLRDSKHKMSTGTTSLTWSPIHSHLLVSGGFDGCIRLWDIRKGNQACVLDREYIDPCPREGLIPFEPSLWKNQSACVSSNMSHSGFVAAIRFTPNGSTLVSAGSDGTLSTWNMLKPHGELMPCRYYYYGKNRKHTTALAPITAQLQPLTLIATREYVWTHSQNSLLAYQIGKTGPPCMELKGHLKRVNTISMIPDYTKQIISGSSDGLLLMWSGRQQSQESRDSNNLKNDEDRW